VTKAAIGRQVARVSQQPAWPKVKQEICMQQTVVRVICAIGHSGQLGLNGVLPWEGDKRPEFVADVARFFDITRGHVLLAGPRTIASVPEFARADRTLFVLRSSMDPEETLRKFAGRVVFIGGGPPVWDVYARFVSHWDITRLPTTARRTAGSIRAG
jgi:dihydromethanopterin reductase